ncbi:MAG TPA: hypothetical protein VGH27_19915 [Streptosporangiaceae bacterium]|jgi:hypothetical protein
MTTDELDAILASANIKGSQIQRTELEAICRSVCAVPAAEFIDAVTQAPGLSWDDGQTRPAGYFEIHSRYWSIDVSDAGNRQHLLAVTTAAALVGALHLNFSISWVTRVWPAALAIQSISWRDDGLHLGLVRQGVTPIPLNLAASVNPSDYADFTKAVDGAPAVLPLEGGGTITFA